MIVMDSSNLLSMGRTDHSEISPPRRWPERVPEKEIRCRFIILARKDELTPDYAPDYAKRRTDTGLRADTGLREHITQRQARKSGVGSGKEIRCRSIILARKDEPTLDYAPCPNFVA